MAIHLYGDESGVIGNRLFLIGLLFVESKRVAEHEKFLNTLKVTHRFLYKELHYSELNPKQVDFAKACVDWFIGTGGVVFKCTVVQAELFHTKKFQGNLKFISAEEMSYNVIYKSTVLWHLDNDERDQAKVVIVDKKDKARPDEFERYMRAGIPNVSDFQEAKSENHNLLQIADMMLGCVNGDLNGVQKYAKRNVINHLKSRLNIEDFKERNEITKEKFRVTFWKPPENKKAQLQPSLPF